MKVAAWILLIVFAFHWLGSLTVEKKSWSNYLLMYFEIIVVAVSAGIIWG